MKIQILATDNMFDTGVSTLMDTLGIANELAPSVGLSVPQFEVSLVGLRRRIRTANGFIVPVVPVNAAVRPDVMVVPALGAKMPPALALALEKPEVVDATAWLSEVSGGGTMVCAACTGTFLLAGTALLDGHRATTSWWLAPMFRERFPQIELDESRMLVNSGGFVTAGAAMAHLDLALWLVRSRSPELASLTARYLLVDARTTQAAYVIPDHMAHNDPLVERFERWARQRLAEGAQGFSLGGAALAVGASERTLARRLRAVMGKTPLSYFQDLRVERATYLLQTSKASVDQVAAKVGYADGTTLRALLRRKLGRGV
ncbi:MAG: helix-turn-helix domain-containing protein, partial [Pseudomonadota bacterium]